MVKPMSKALLRHNLLSRRAAITADPQPLIAHICSYIAAHGIATAAAYVPTATEPGGGLALIDALTSATQTLYLPAIAAQRQLTWGTYTAPSDLRRGRFNIPEPREAPWANNVLASCELVLVPGLACTPGGVRLGRGGGFYDRALAGLDRRVCELAVVLHPWEVLDDIEFEPHDILMDRIFTAEGTVRCLRDV